MKKGIVFENKLQDLIKDFDSENVQISYKLPEDFTEETGIHTKRFNHLFNNKDAEMSYSEAVILARYLTKKTGQNITPEMLMQEIENNKK